MNIQGRIVLAQKHRDGLRDSINRLADKIKELQSEMNDLGAQYNMATGRLAELQDMLKEEEENAQNEAPKT